MTNPYYNPPANIPSAHTLGRSSTISQELQKIRIAFDLVETRTISSVSPALTGTPTAPTLSPGDTSTKLANGAFVMGEIATLAALKANIDSPVLTGVPQSPTAAPGASTDQIATTQFTSLAVAALAATKVSAVSPALTGIPTAPTPAPGTATAQLATAQFVANAIAGVNAQVALTLSVVSATSVALVAGSIYVLTNPAKTDCTLPPIPASGDELMIVQTNGLKTNSYDAGAQSVTGSTGFASGVITMDDGKSVRLKYVNNTVKWVIL